MPAQLVVALDLDSRTRALELADSLQGIVPWLKVGLQLFSAHGPGLVRELKERGFNVFVDLKMFDIPNTVQHGIAALAHAGADMATIHLLGGERMAQAALQGAHDGADGAPLMQIFGVTILTSASAEDLPFLPTATSNALPDLVLQLAQNAVDWGLSGIVCSGQELPALHARHGARLSCLCPGIRPMGAASHDQKRIVTPEYAVRAGANYLVVGRPITESPHPEQAAQEICAEICSAMRLN